jgi:hypothetical protein
VALLIILMIFSFSMQFLSIAPQYATFGSQLTSSMKPCALVENSTKFKDARMNSQNHNLCELTQLTSFYNKIIMSMPLFSIIYFILNWLYICTFTFFLVYSFLKQEKKLKLKVITIIAFISIVIWKWRWNWGHALFSWKRKGLSQKWWREGFISDGRHWDIRRRWLI